MGDDGVAGRSVLDMASRRGRAAYLYGLIVSGAVLATAPNEFSLARVGLMLLGTLAIYYGAETYVHWMATRTLVHRDLVRAERGQILRDGWPLFTACAMPLLFLTVEAVLGVETSRALDLALILNALLMFAVGWRMGKDGGLKGLRFVLSVAAAGFLGVALVVLKTLGH